MQDSSILDHTGERQFFGPELIQEAEEQVRIIRENLRVAQTRQKRRIKVKGKLSLRFIGPFIVL
jgi:hypothetical protein